MTFITVNAVNKKPSFSLVELILVIVLISLTYTLFVPKMTLYSDKKEILSLINIKSYLKKNFDYEENLTFSCTDTTCYIFVDNKMVENFEVKNLFSSLPVVYQNNEILEFLDITIDNISYSVVFELSFDKDYKSKDLLLEANSLFYFYNSIKDEVSVFETLGAYEDSYENLKMEVSDAF